MAWSDLMVKGISSEVVQVGVSAAVAVRGEVDA